MTKSNPTTVRIAADWSLLMRSLGARRVPSNKEDAIQLVAELRDYWRTHRPPTANCKHEYPNLTRAASHGSDVEQSILRLYKNDGNDEILDTLLSRLCAPVEVLRDLDDFSRLVVTIEGAVRTGRNQQKKRAAAAIVAKKETEQATEATRIKVRRTKRRQKRVARA